MEDYRIILADDHPLIRQGIKKFLSEIPSIKVIGEAANGRELLEILNKSTPNLVILDIGLPDLDGIEVARKIKDNFPQIKILFLTMYSEGEFVYEAISTGAEGYLVKSDSDTELKHAITNIMRGENYLSPSLYMDLTALLFEKCRHDTARRLEESSISPREREIIKLIASGNTSRQIGEKLFISERTVHRHRANIMKKLGLKRTIELGKYAFNTGCF
ncbi:MAG: response regulator transcription factor [Syntrophobacterales bacterium]|jgi:DNA-binding NarL/FixJ family response regulator|nr:response regulator transcription factor [Syntrophobacterales bacterium]